MTNPLVHLLVSPAWWTLKFLAKKDCPPIASHGRPALSTENKKMKIQQVVHER